MIKALKFLLKLLLFAVLALVTLFVVFLAVYSYRINSLEKHLSQSDKAYIIIYDTKTEVSADDVQALKDVFLVDEFVEAGPGASCGFVDNYAVEFVNSKKGKGVIVCPALDRCKLFEVNGKVYEVSDKTRSDFDIIVKKYGLTFPNI